jgi:hypothetical protein
MKKEEMNKIIGMLDDDVIADALGEKRAASKGALNRRKFVTTLIAATLAVAILASTLIIALGRHGGEERVNILPPVGSYVKTASGNGIVVDENPLTGTLYVRLGEDAAPIKVHRTEVEVLSRSKNKKPVKPVEEEE